MGGAGAYDVDMFKVAAFAVRATGIREEAESKESTSGRHSEGEDDGDKKVLLLFIDYTSYKILCKYAECETVQ